MFNVKNYDYDCTRNCRLPLHGNAITAVLTKRSISDEKLAAFIAKTCNNYCNIVDELGRSAVHLAASVDRYVILEWLLNQGSIINSCDYESGSSPLHRAIYYGCIDCAVLLMRYGASLELLDQDTRCALQNVCRLQDFPHKFKDASNNDILVWGSNKNNNLGVGKNELLNSPQTLDFFRKSNISIKMIALGVYHSLFLDKKCQLFAVGHGNGGRLGNGNEVSLALPKRVKVPIKNSDENIICISVSHNHSLLLTNKSLVFACGLNDKQQLGVRDAGAKLTNFKEVVTLRDNNVQGLKHIIALDDSSVVYSDKYIYVWGANYGQFNLDGKIITLPKQMKLPPIKGINFVVTNNSATVVHTNENTILLFYNHKFRTIKPPNFESLKSISIVGGDAGKGVKGSATALKLLLLTKTNVLFFWYETTQMLYRCIFAHLRITQIDKLIYKANQVLILSQGDVYLGKCNQISVPQYVNKQQKKSDIIWKNNDQNRTEISTEYMIRIDLNRLSYIDRAVDIFTDDDFTSFAVLQESYMKYFKSPNLKPEEYTFKKLYHEVSEFDAIHDIVFHLDDEIFPAHKLLIYARAPGLHAIIKNYDDKHIYLNYKHLTGKIFELVLNYIYTNYFPNDEDVDLIQQSLGPDIIEFSERIDICNLLLKYVEQFQLNDLSNYLKYYLEQRPFLLPHIPDKSKYRFNRLRRKNFPEFYDVRIICENDIELSAHKCILVARLQYFEMMFTHSWAEQTKINLSTVTAEYMEPILDFLYSSDIEQFRKRNFSETFLYNTIVLCDQFFIERLREVCEILLLDRIRIRKCAEMLEFAYMYNCQLLKSGCMDFICQNLARILQFKYLDDCDPAALKCLNAHYRTMFKEVFDYRMITPDSEAIEDELLLSFVDDFQVNLNEEFDEEKQLAEFSGNSKTTKSLENKTKYSNKQHERAAILEMMRAINLNENLNSLNDNKTHEIIKEAQKSAEKLQTTAHGWSKVIDKKEQKKPRALVCNEILKTEDKPKMNYTPLTPPITATTTTTTTTTTENNAALKLTPGKEKEKIHYENTTPSKVHNLSLLDFTPTTTTTKTTHEKLSQKQRKRLSSLRNNDIAIATTPQEPTKSIDIIAATPTTPNAWGILPQSPTYSMTSTPPTGSAADPTSFANMMRTTTTVGTTTSKDSTADNSFTKILADERKQREYYERMRSKSLVLTQIEETAIAELREFYNVDNVTDEIITIERKSLPVTMNFATWQRH